MLNKSDDAPKNHVLTRSRPIRCRILLVLSRRSPRESRSSTCRACEDRYQNNPSNPSPQSSPSSLQLPTLKMALSMHSHSGQFCPGHAKDTLDEVIQTAISRGMQTLALTEHMPRESDSDLYPEEVRLHLLSRTINS